MRNVATIAVNNSFSLSVKEMATCGIKQCSICQDDLKTARLLPCLHAFCLECLERYCRDGLPGDDARCPVCRTDFQIPKNGVAGLPARTHVADAAFSATCEVCSVDRRRPPATVYCFDCTQKLCDRCSLPHRKMKAGSHDVRSLESTSLPDRGGERCCGEHKEPLRMYCVDCEIDVCLMCCVTTHNAHNYEQSWTVPFAGFIDDDIKPVASRIERFRAAAAQLASEHDRLLDNIAAIEVEVKERNEAVKQLVDRQQSDLLCELQSLKSAAEKERDSRTDALQAALTEMESFKTSSSKLKSKVSRSDVTQAVNDVRVRANYLLRTYVVPQEYRAPSYKFTPANIDKLLFLGDGQNFIGHVTKNENLGYSY